MPRDQGEVAKTTTFLCVTKWLPEQGLQKVFASKVFRKAITKAAVIRAGTASEEVRDSCHFKIFRSDKAKISAQ